tara:strand:- start:4588 stop:5109 length:522 start_codon:yes stop_codon:yes gene_type:complete
MAKFTIKNARLSFPAIFKRAEFDNVETKFEGTLLLDKDSQADQIEQINKRIDAFLAEKFPKGAPKSVKRTVFIDGDTKDYDGYENHMAFKGSNNKRPTVIDRDKTPLVEEDGKLEAGDYCNAIVDLWYSDHPKGGKQVLGNLLGLQFVKEGERFGTDTTASVDEFEELEDDDF